MRVLAKSENGAIVEMTQFELEALNCIKSALDGKSFVSSWNMRTITGDNSTNDDYTTAFRSIYIWCEQAFNLNAIEECVKKIRADMNIPTGT